MSLWSVETLQITLIKAMHFPQLSKLLCWSLRIVPFSSIPCFQLNTPLTSPTLFEVVGISKELMWRVTQHDVLVTFITALYLCIFCIDCLFSNVRWGAQWTLDLYSPQRRVSVSQLTNYSCSPREIFSIKTTLCIFRKYDYIKWRTKNLVILNFTQEQQCYWVFLSDKTRQPCFTQSRLYTLSSFNFLHNFEFALQWVQVGMRENSNISHILIYEGFGYSDSNLKNIPVRES